MMAEFRRVILPIKIVDTQSFVFSGVKRVNIEIPKDFLAAFSGYGRHYGIKYGYNF
jgi:hypothetical protein